MLCMRCGRPVVGGVPICPVCQPGRSGRDAWRRHQRRLLLRQVVVVVGAALALMGAMQLLNRWTASEPDRPVAHRRVSPPPANAPPVVRGAPDPPRRVAVAQSSGPAQNGGLQTSPNGGAGAPADSQAAVPVVPRVSNVPPERGSWTRPAVAPTPQRFDDGRSQPVQPPPRGGTAQGGSGSASGSTQQPGFVVGIVRVQRYQTSCVIWGFIYNQSGVKQDLDLMFKLRDADGDLCQKSASQRGSDDWTLHHDSMLYFWPAFSWMTGGEYAPEGYSNSRPLTKALGAMEITVAGQSYRLPVTDGITNLGLLTSLDPILLARVRAQLGDFPDDVMGAQLQGR